MVGFETEPISVVICTRNRGSSIVDALNSIFASSHPDYTVIVVDQSTNDETRRAVAAFRANPRFHYVRTETTGLGIARNIGLAHATTRVVAMTDDDCVVQSDWLETMAQIFAEHSQVAVAFCHVHPAEHDKTVGFIPAYQCQGKRLSVSPYAVWSGIGAGMAVRRSAVIELGGFDEMLGAGAVFPAAEEGDLVTRALLGGYHVFETDATGVVHFGYRTFQEGKALAQRDCYASGAACAKPIRVGKIGMVKMPLNIIWHFFNLILDDLLSLRRPRGLKRITAFVRGFQRGWKTPIDRTTLLFVSPEPRLIESKLATLVPHSIEAEPGTLR